MNVCKNVCEGGKSVYKIISHSHLLGVIRPLTWANAVPTYKGGVTTPDARFRRSNGIFGRDSNFVDNFVDSVYETPDTPADFVDNRGVS